MAGMCCGVVGETKTPTSVEHKNGRQRRRMDIDMDMDIRQLKFLAAAASDVIMPLPESTRKRRKVDTVQNSGNETTPKVCENDSVDIKRDELVGTSSETLREEDVSDKENSRFGLTVVCGRRRDLEDAVAVKPALVNRDRDDLHFYGVYDGHGCSHVII